MNPYYHDEKTGITIYHSDAREVLPTLADGSVDFIFTDPPYGHNNNNGDLIHRWEAALGRGPVAVEDARPIANDGAVATSELIAWAFPEFARLVKPGCCCCCCCGGGGPDPQFARWSLLIDEAFTRGIERGFKQMVVWDKGPIGMGWHYRRSYETVLVAQKPGASCRWYDTTDRVENIVRHIPKIIPTATMHPTPKPTGLAQHFMLLHTQPGDLVLDPFAGGGSTVEACKNLGRRCIAVELEERWCELAAKRLAQSVINFDSPEAA